MKITSKAYLSNYEWSAQDILPELNLRRIFPDVYFVNGHFQEKKVTKLSE